VYAYLIGCIPDDIKLSLNSEEEGGIDPAKAFADWCEREVRGYKYQWMRVPVGGAW
jgi:hypothetical protein